MLKNCERRGSNRPYGDALYSGAKVMSKHIIRVYANRTQAKKIITILTFAWFSGKGRYTLHYEKS